MADSKHNLPDSRLAQTDDPPNSRLFIVGNKRLNESDFREAFSKFGEIEDIWVVRDRRNGENKGVTYIKYSKTSDAANALEEMNGKVLPGTDRHIKVMIASSRDKGSQREENEDEKIHRLFAIVPKTSTESELRQYFQQFGDIDYVNIVRDKETKENKGFAYIKYYKFSHAAKAFEECDRKYKAVFSEPRKPNMGRYNNSDYSMDRMSGNSMATNMNMGSMSNNNKFDNNDGKGYKLMVIGCMFFTEEQMWKLFNIVPGLDFCELRYENAKNRSVGTAIYDSLQWATHAVDRLHGFEYPPGSRLIVKPNGVIPRQDAGNRRTHMPALDPNNTDIRTLAKTIAQATSLIQSAGFGAALENFGESLNTSDDYPCSVTLPPLQPLANIDSDTEARCFIVCSPPPPPPHILKNIFCRFGNLIDVYMLTNRNCGYAKYASKESALEAMRVLHGAEVCGGRIKVLEADERSDQNRKRLRLDDQ